MALLQLSDSTFEQEVLKSTIPVLVELHADWCAPCHIIAPTIEELAKEYEGKIKVGKMDVDANPTAPSQYGVMSIPTVMLFKSGKPVKTLIGAQGKDAYKNAIEAILGSV